MYGAFVTTHLMKALDNFLYLETFLSRRVNISTTREILAQHRMRMHLRVSAPTDSAATLTIAAIRVPPEELHRLVVADPVMAAAPHLCQTYVLKYLLLPAVPRTMHVQPVITPHLGFFQTKVIIVLVM